MTTCSRRARHVKTTGDESGITIRNLLNVLYNHPTSFKITRLVKEVSCQYAFGVFTKWDKVIQKHEKEHSQISLDFLREKNTTKYLESVNSNDLRTTSDDVFFVDSQQVFRKIEVSFLEALKYP